MAAKPNKVTVGLHEYKILWSKQSWAKYTPKNMNPEELLGLTLHRLGIILVLGDLPDSMQRETLLHEIMHACCGTVGFSDMPVHCSNNEDAEETLIRLLSPELLEVLRANPIVTEYLLGKS